MEAVARKEPSQAEVDAFLASKAASAPPAPPNGNGQPQGQAATPSAASATQTPANSMSAAAPPSGAIPGYTPQMGKDVTEALPTAGGMIGGGLGSLAGPGTAVAGAAIGGALGSAARDWEKNQPLGRHNLIDGLTQGLYEVGGQGVARGLNYVVRGVAGKLAAGAVESSNYIKQLATMYREELLQAGHPVEAVDTLIESGLTAAQAAQGKLIDVAETIAKGSAVTQAVNSVYEAQDDLWRLAARDAAKNFGPALSKAQVARMFANSVRNAQEIGRGRIGGMYDVIGKRLETVDLPTTIPGQSGKIVRETGSTAGLVDLGPVRNALSRQRANIEELGKSLLDPEGVTKLVNTIDTLPPGKISFDAAKQLRTDIQDLARRVKMVDDKAQFVDAADELDGFLTRAMKKAVVDFDQAIAARGVPKGDFKRGPVAPLLDLANKTTKAFHEAQNSAFMRSMVSLADEKLAAPQILDDILQPQNPERINFVLDTIGRDTHEADMIRSWHLRSMMEGAMKQGATVTKLASKTSKVPGGEALSEAFGALTKGPGEDMLLALHGPERLANYRRMASAMQTAQAKGFSEGSLFIKLLEASGVGGAVVALANPWGSATSKGLTIAGAGTYLIGMKTLSRLLASPKTANWLINATKFGVKTREGAAAAARILSLLGPSETTKLTGKESLEEYGAKINRQRQLNNAGAGTAE